MKSTGRLVIANVLLIFGSTAAIAESLRALEIGEPRSYELEGADAHQFVLRGHSAYVVIVENLGRGTILTVRDSNGNKVTRAATWRGTEGRYGAVFDVEESAILEVAPDEPVAPPGQYSISARAIDRTDPLVVAEFEMSEGADRRNMLHTRAAQVRSAEGFGGSKA